MKGSRQRELTKDVHLRMSPEMHARLIELARADDRDIGNMIRALVSEAMNARAGRRG